MKKLALTTVLICALFAGLRSDAAGVGYIDYDKVVSNYSYAQQSVKEIDAKALELQQYMIDKEKQYKALDTPLKKQNFEEQTAREMKLKEDSLLRLRAQREEQIYNKIQNASRDVLLEQKLDAIISSRVIFVGGVDISELVIQKLKSGKY